MTLSLNIMNIGRKRKIIIKKKYDGRNKILLKLDKGLLCFFVLREKSYVNLFLIEKTMILNFIIIFMKHHLRSTSSSILMLI